MEASCEQVSESMLDASQGEGENDDETVMALKRSLSAELQERKKRAQHKKNKKSKQSNSSTVLVHQQQR